jgi:hypothetical protein
MWADGWHLGNRRVRTHPGRDQPGIWRQRVLQTLRDWDGKQWEARCVSLLRMRYKQPGQFERIPSADQGDLGIEGFSHDGCVYQCYAPDGPLPTRDRYERQRDKLTEDVGKLATNQAELIAVLGGVVIRLYAFMTPTHDSRRLNRHAKTKAADIRAMCLAHCAEDFDIVIQTEEDYAVEQRELMDLGLNKLHLTRVPMPEAAVHSYCTSNPDLIATIDGKLANIPGLGTSERTALRMKLLRQKLIADNKLSEIRGHNAPAWERIQGMRADREATLEIESVLSTEDPGMLIAHTAQNYRDCLRASMTFLTESDASDLAWGTTTDWLAECPLDFRTGSAL